MANPYIIKHYKEAYKIINSTLLLILILSCVSFFIISGILSSLSILSFVLSFLVAPFVYEKIVSIINNQQLDYHSLTFVKKLSYYIIINLILSLLIAFASICIGNYTSRLTNYAITAFISASINSFSIYIYPFIFLKEMGFRSILAGYKFAIKNLKMSYSLIFAVFILWVMNSLLNLSKGMLYHENILVWSVVSICQSYAFHYLNFFIFSIVTMVIANSSKFDDSH